MTSKTATTGRPQDSELMTLLRAIAAREVEEASRLLAVSPGLARQVIGVGATRGDASDYYFETMSHHVYAGDSALHVAAAAYTREAAVELIAKGANPRARNRRGAEPLHYATDGVPGSPAWNPDAQGAIVEYLIDAGADPNSADKSGVTPLHRAVRTRCASAVSALLARGAEPRRKSGSGATPLHLAVQGTGRGGTGSSDSRQQQKDIILLLLQHGARLTDKDAHGKTVKDSLVGNWIHELLGAC